jgi:hypothetical protein
MVFTNLRVPDLAYKLSAYVHHQYSHKAKDIG